MLYLVIGIIVLNYLLTTGLSILNYSYKDKEVPKEVQGIYDEKDYKKWHSYFMENFRFGMITRTVYMLVTVILLATKVYHQFFTFSESLTQNEYSQLGIFLLLYYFIGFILGIFTSYYDKFTIEEKYGFNKSTKKTFVVDKVKALILVITFGGGLAMGIFALYRTFQDQLALFLLFSWLGIIFIIIVVNMIYVKVLMPIFNKVTALEEGELKDAINHFAEGVGYTVSKISVIDASKRSTKLNAMFTGFGKFKHIILFDTLIEKMSTEEIVAVLAHEIGHNKHKHIITSMGTTFIQFGLFLGLLVLTLTTKSIYLDSGFEAIFFGYGLIIFLELVSAIDIVFAPFLNAMIRRGEYQADHYASTKYNKESMISALRLLSKENFSNLTPHPLFVKIRYSHPPVYQRIRAINKI